MKRFLLATMLFLMGCDLPRPDAAPGNPPAPLPSPVRNHVINPPDPAPEARPDPAPAEIDEAARRKEIFRQQIARQIEKKREREARRAQALLAPPPAADDEPEGLTSVSPSPHHAGTGGSVHVRGYTRKDGTYVRPHTRRSPRRH